MATAVIARITAVHTPITSDLTAPMIVVELRRLGINVVLAPTGD